VALLTSGVLATGLNGDRSGCEAGGAGVAGDDLGDMDAGDAGFTGSLNSRGGERARSGLLRELLSPSGLAISVVGCDH
jgi:hypothetical protein